MKNEILNRVKIIRESTPNCLNELFEMQNRLCDLCGHPIQDLILASLDHSTPVIHFARGVELLIGEATQLANDLNNLRCVHSSCNSMKRDKTREEWFAAGFNQRVEKPKAFIKEQILNLRFRLGAGGRISGHRNGCKMLENKIGIFAPGFNRSIGGLTANKLYPDLANKNGCKVLEKKIGIFAPDFNLSAAGKKGGQKIRKEKLGIFAIDFDRNKGNRAGGLISGRKLRDNKLGIFKRTSEQKSQDGRKGGLKNVESGHIQSLAKIASHKRWHVDRGILNPNCFLCAVTRGY